VDETADQTAGGILHVADPSPNGGCRDRGVEPELWPVHNYMT
jgi:hypothetical protein